MNNAAASPPGQRLAAIACGGTGGHLFPGLAVGRELLRRGCAVTLLISSKEIDRQAAQAAQGMEIVTLPAVGFSVAGLPGFAWRSWQSYLLSKKHFRQHRPQFVLAMGGFTAAPPIWAARRLGAQTFLHESNTIPGRANRWLARSVDGAFVYFDSAAARLRARRVEKAGMPVRPELLQLTTAAAAQTALGLKAGAPTLLVMGGSQGARAINEAIMGLLPQLREAAPELQFIHLTGPADLARVQAAYAAGGSRVFVRAFLSEMAPALAAADVAVSRAGASSLAEFAAVGLPAVLIPYPSAADDHQYYNALSFAQSGAARMLPQKSLTSAQLTGEILDLLANPLQRSIMRQALRRWHAPEAAAQIADKMLHWTAPVRSVPDAAAPGSNAPKLGVLNV